MLSVNTNISSLAAQQTLQTNARGTARVMEQLSTGKRINSSADDVAGLAISTRLMSQIRGLNQAIRNGNDAISLLQTADQAAENVTGMLQRMRELSIQYANDTNNTQDRSYIKGEIVSLRGEIIKVSNNTNWNGKSLLDGRSHLSFKITPNISDSADISITLPNISGPISPPISMVAENNNSASISVFTPNSDGTYTEQQLNSDNYSKNVIIADFNKDGYQDIISSNLFLNDGTGNFTKSAALSSPDHSDVSVADVNKDGYLDILTNNGTVSLYLNQKNGTLSAPLQFGSSITPNPFISNYTGNRVWNAFLYDFNLDGKQDILALEQDPNNFIGATLSVYTGNGNGSFAYKNTISGFNIYSQVSIGDINQDGINDIVSSSTQSPSVSYLIGNSDGTFSSPIALDENSYSYPSRASIADINNDGLNDVVVAEFGWSDIVTFTNSNNLFVKKNIHNSQGISRLTLSDFNSDGNIDAIIGQGDGLAFFKNDGFGNFVKDKTVLSSTIGYYIDNWDNVLTTGVLKTPDLNLRDIENALNLASSVRANIGSIMSRIQFATENLSNTSSQAQQSQSRILDTDYSAATTELAKRNIIQQAAQAMLAQANQQPQAILQLLKSTG